MESLEGFDVSTENLGEAQRIFREDGEELKAICSEIELVQPEAYRSGFELDDDLKASGISSIERRGLLAQAGILIVAKYLDGRTDLDDFLGEVL